MCCVALATKPSAPAPLGRDSSWQNTPDWNDDPPDDDLWEPDDPDDEPFPEKGDFWIDTDDDED